MGFWNFNPRSHVGNDLTVIITFAPMLNFNPRSHVGNDECFYQLFPPHQYFNPRSHVGNDSPTSIIHVSIGNFNPRSHVGNDALTPAQAIDEVISIHVPTWGTTNESEPFFSLNAFQSTFPRGERLFFLLLMFSIC